MEKERLKSIEERLESIEKRLDMLESKIEYSSAEAAIVKEIIRSVNNSQRLVNLLGHRELKFGY